MTAKRLHVWCPACRWRGKVLAAYWRDLEATGQGEPCRHCEAAPALVRGTPPKGGTVGRPRLTVADKLRKKAAELVAIAAELDAM